jgi:lysozyme
MKTSQNGLSLIESFEGLRLNVYLDIVNRETIGFGHLILPGESFPDGITKDVAQVILANDVSKVETPLNEWQPNLNQNQFDALVDFGFNLGIGALHQLLSHGLDQLPTQIMEWDHAGGKVVAGLQRRRAAELALFQTPVA